VIELPSWMMLGAWFVMQILYAALDHSLQVMHVGWYAHITGFVYGMVFYYVATKLEVVQNPRAVLR
jgi:membrane associated rhomboid family serine protease